MALLAERTPVRLDAIQALVEAPGPWASLYVGLSDRDPQGLPVERAARWHAMATTLVDGGATADAVETLGRLVLAEPPGPAVLAAFAPAQGAVHSFRVPGLFTADAVHVAPLPRVVPLLEWLQEHPPHVVVVTDRTGADVDAVSADGDSRRWTVIGGDDEIERNAPGGWAQPRYQRRAEDSWRHNAAQVAEAVTTAVGESGARVVIAAGDVRAVQLLEDRLPTGLRKDVAWRHIAGSRSPDGSQRTRPDRVDETVQAVVGDETLALLRRFAEERAPAGIGREGVQETLAALARGQVAALLVVPEELEGRTAWFGPKPSDVLPGEADPPADWGGPAVRAPLVDVAVRAALGARGQVWLVPDGLPGSPADGIGAFCRFR